MGLGLESGAGLGAVAAAAIAAGIGLGAAAYFSPWLWRKSRMGRIRRQLKERRILALTYDDGPSAAVTPQLLDLLKSRGAHATFFMLGCHAEKNPAIVERVMAEGHEIGCHSDQHLNAWKVAPWRAVSDIRAGYGRLSPWIPGSALYRPPYGKMTLSTYRELRRRGAPVWWWTLDSYDTNTPLPASQQVAERLRQDGGGVVLMHDLDRGEERKDFVVKTTQALLDVAEQEAMQVMTIGEFTRSEV